MPNQDSEGSDDAQVPNCVKSYKDSLRLLKPIEEFALKPDNFGAIELLTLLKEVFRAGEKSADSM